MKFHFYVTLDIPGETLPDGLTLAGGYAAIRPQLEHACAVIVPSTDSTWIVKPIGRGVEVLPLVQNIARLSPHPKLHWFIRFAEWLDWSPVDVLVALLIAFTTGMLFGSMAWVLR